MPPNTLQLLLYLLLPIKPLLRRFLVSCFEPHSHQLIFLSFSLAQVPMAERESAKVQLEKLDLIELTRKYCDVPAQIDYRPNNTALTVPNRTSTSSQLVLIKNCLAILRDTPHIFALGNQTHCSAAQFSGAFSNCLQSMLAEFRTTHNPNQPDRNALHTLLRNLQAAFTNASTQYVFVSKNYCFIHATGNHGNNFLLYKRLNSRLRTSKDKTSPNTNSGKQFWTLFILIPTSNIF